MAKIIGLKVTANVSFIDPCKLIVLFPVPKHSAFVTICQSLSAQTPLARLTTYAMTETIVL